MASQLWSLLMKNEVTLVLERMTVGFGTVVLAVTMEVVLVAAMEEDED